MVGKKGQSEVKEKKKTKPKSGDLNAFKNLYNKFLTNTLLFRLGFVFV